MGPLALLLASSPLFQNLSACFAWSMLYSVVLIGPNQRTKCTNPAGWGIYVLYKFLLLCAPLAKECDEANEMGEVVL